MRISIIEGEKRLAQTLADLLTRYHYLADISYDGESGLDNIQAEGQQMKGPHRQGGVATDLPLAGVQ